MKKIIILLIIIIMFLSKADTISAEFDVVEESAKLSLNSEFDTDQRVFILRKFFITYNSPLADYSYYFVKYADDYGLDWRLVPAITGVESSFGKNIPINSYNAYGWANGAISFDSWEESIYIVSKALGEKYIAKGATTVEKIGKIYAPPSKTWASNVKYFMAKIEPAFLEFTI